MRIADQILEGLVELAPGGTRVVPGLATSWKVSPDGRVWTFVLRRGVRFQDGTRLDAAAVCFNFERWYGFTGSLQRAAYLLGVVFGGFRNPEADDPRPRQSLYRGCQRVSTDPRFASVLRAPPRRSWPHWRIRASASRARRRSGGTTPTEARSTPTARSSPTGTYGTAHPAGTGPFRFGSWRRGRELVLVRNPTYWGKKGEADRLVFRPITDRTARLRALQRGAIHGYDEEAVGAVDTAQARSKIEDPRPPSAMTGYVGINQAIPPMDKLLVRQAVAYGLDRARSCGRSTTGRAEVADQFLPPAFAGYAKKVKRYRY